MSAGSWKRREIAARTAETEIIGPSSPHVQNEVPETPESNPNRPNSDNAISPYVDYLLCQIVRYGIMLH